MKKIIVRGGLVLVALVIVGLVVLYFSLNSIVKSQVQAQGTKATGVQTTLQSVNINPLSGALTLNNFFLANPEGFSDSKLFSLGEADVQVKLGTLVFGDEVVVPKLEIDGATVLVELNGTKLNTIALLEQVQKQGHGGDAGTDGEAPEPDAPETEAPGEPRGFLVNELSITNVRLAGRLAMPGGIEQDIDIPLSPIRETDVRGVDMADVIAFAVETIMLNASRDVIEFAPDFAQLQGQLDDAAGQVMDNVGDRLNQAVPGLGDAAKEAGGKEVGKALDDLFGNKKDDAEQPE